MKRALRYRLSEGIAEALRQQQLTLQEIDIYLASFGVGTPYQFDDFGVNNQRAYILGTITHKANDAAISEMAEDLAVASPKELSPPKAWVSELGVRLFISHLAIEKHKAMRLRDCLRAYGISGFVAHEDIEPAALWQEEIERALFVMDAFVSIHTPGFAASSWTQQEVGFACARRVPIISLKMVSQGEDPTGFIGRQQALLRYNESAEQIAGRISELLGKEPVLANKMGSYLFGDPKRFGT